MVVVGAAPAEDPPRGDVDRDDAPVVHAAARTPTTANTRTVRIRRCTLTIVDVLPKVVSSRSVSPEPEPSPVAGTRILARGRPWGPEPGRMKACGPHRMRRTVCSRGGEDLVDETGVDVTVSGGGSPRVPSRARAVMPTVLFDIVGPLVVYDGLKGAGLSNVSALVVSGVLPAFRVVGGLVTHRRIDAIGVLVVAGIVVGTAVGLVSHSARLVLLEGVVPTAVFAVVCLGSLATSRPMMYRIALSFVGPGTPRGREFVDLWRYEGFRHAFRVITVVWGLAYLVEAAAKAVIVSSMSISSAKAVTQVLPYGVGGVVALWNVWYARRRRAEGERLRAEGERLRAGTGAGTGADVGAYGEEPPALPA